MQFIVTSILLHIFGELFQHFLSIGCQGSENGDYHLRCGCKWLQRKTGNSEQVTKDTLEPILGTFSKAAFQGSPRGLSLNIPQVFGKQIAPAEMNTVLCKAYTSELLVEGLSTL